MGADLRAALVASCLRGALPPVDLRAVCLVRAICEERVGRRRELLEDTSGGEKDQGVYGGGGRARSGRECACVTIIGMGG